jgi:hypothetical protein
MRVAEGRTPTPHPRHLTTTETTETTMTTTLKTIPTRTARKTRIAQLVLLRAKVLRPVPTATTASYFDRVLGIS